MVNWSWNPSHSTLNCCTYFYFVFYLFFNALCEGQKGLRNLEKGLEKKEPESSFSWLWRNSLIEPITQSAAHMPTSKPISRHLPETVRLGLCWFAFHPHGGRNSHPILFSGFKAFSFRAPIMTHRTLFCCLVTRFWRPTSQIHTSVIKWTCYYRKTQSNTCTQCISSMNSSIITTHTHTHEKK